MNFETTTKIGVLLVHGIGEQLQFEHLEGEARNIALALKESAAQATASKALNVHVALNTLPSAAFGSQQETWHNGDHPSLMVEVYDEQNLTQIYFHQVWWADLDEPITLGTEIRFWLWGLSLWAIKGVDPSTPGYDQRMAQHEKTETGHTSISSYDRLRLFWVALVILLTLPVLSLLKFVLRGLLDLNIPRPDVLAQFIGDVKLFQQNSRLGKGPLQDLGLPPRVTIRRRMVRGMVEMALRPYDHWYILAHSQGSVVAFNGIMETAQSLPNYLTEELLHKARKNSLIRLAQGDECLSSQEGKLMWPNFPSWRDKDYILDRRELFKNLRGMLTYGSPLSKFAALWPVIVPLNRDFQVFNPDFCWFNIYDPTDPVAGQTKSFLPEKFHPQAIHVTQTQSHTYKAAKPIDIAYKANRFHLLSHTEYLTYSKGNHDQLVNKVANWLLTGTLLNVKPGSPGWPTEALAYVYEFVRKTVWVFLALLFGGILSELIAVAVPELSSHLQPAISFALNAMPIWLKWTATAVYLSGILAMLGSLIGGVRLLTIGFALGFSITLILAILPTPFQLQILNWILLFLLGGILYILIGAIIVLAVGTVVKLIVNDLGNL